MTSADTAPIDVLEDLLAHRFALRSVRGTAGTEAMI